MIEKMNLHYSFTNPASIHDEEALTALELAGRQGAKINEVVEAQNKVREDVDHQIKTVIPETISSDVQKHIDNGDFDHQIEENNAEFIAEVSGKIGTLTARVDNLVSNTPVGGTTSDAELIDIRVGANGTTYSSAGQAVRAQFKEAIRKTGKSVSASNYATTLPDANKITDGGVLFISSSVTSGMTANLPVYGKYGMIMQFNYGASEAHGLTQLYTNLENGDMYVRGEIGGGESYQFTAWRKMVTSEVYEKAFIKTNKQLSASNYESITTDINHCTDELLFIGPSVTSEMVANLPQYGTYAMLMQFNYHASEPHGFIQMWMDLQTGTMYVRGEVGGGDAYNFSKWRKLLYNESLDKAFLKKALYLQPSNYAEIMPDGKTLPGGGIAFVGTGITREMLPDLPEYGTYGLLIQMNYDAVNPHGFSQYYMNLGTGAFYVRGEYGVDDTYVLSKWHKMVGNDDIGAAIRAELQQMDMSHPALNHLCSIFEHVVCCGDSYTAGFIDLPTGDASPRNVNFAYPRFMEKLTGSKYVNCGESGTTVISWQNATYGLPLAREVGLTQAYIIGLGINDSGSGNVPLGTANDIGVSNSTYYGGMSRIIRELNAISPLAKIFVCTNPRAANENYNAAVRNIVTAYKATYPVHLLDLSNYKNLYNSDILNNDYIAGHYTAIGYQQFAEILCIVMSDYIANHIDEFRDVHLIPYNKEG